MAEKVTIRLDRTDALMYLDAMPEMFGFLRPQNLRLKEAISVALDQTDPDPTGDPGEFGRGVARQVFAEHVADQTEGWSEPPWGDPDGDTELDKIQAAAKQSADGVAAKDRRIAELTEAIARHRSHKRLVGFPKPEDETLWSLLGDTETDR